MRRQRHIITAIVAVTCALGAPATASAGGVDPTRWCIQASANEYLYYPYTVSGATELVMDLKSCGQRFAMHLADARKRAAWQNCIEYGLHRSIPPLMWDPLIAALYDCTARWLEFQVQVDPYP